MKNAQRYEVVAFSESSHCCFEATVVDNHTPLREGSKKPDWVCECFDIPQAEQIAAALNRDYHLLEALEGLVKINDEHNLAVEAICGRPLGWKDSYLDAARAAIARAKGEPQ